MNKDLTPLEIVKRWKSQIHWKQDWGWDKELSIVEKALKETEKLRQLNCKLLEQKDVLREERDKYKKALEIIKNKGISTCSVALNYGDDWERYSKSCFRNYNPLTKEEYELLKEILK